MVSVFRCGLSPESGAAVCANWFVDLFSVLSILATMHAGHITNVIIITDYCLVDDVPWPFSFSMNRRKCGGRFSSHYHATNMPNLCPNHLNGVCARARARPSPSPVLCSITISIFFIWHLIRIMNQINEYFTITPNANNTRNKCGP